ncbi:MAG: ABC transporter permease [Gemmatimonadota bacterium]|nr:ABC transporter permease [Gemmatimonadota bacterium]
MFNLKLAFRTLFKTPFVTVVAALSLALGIGTNTAIFSLFDQILRRPLPVHEPERLVNLSAPGPKPGSTSCNQAGSCEDVFSYAMFRDLERARTQFSGIAAHVEFGANVRYGKQTVNATGMLVSGSYFALLGVRPAFGRLLAPADDQTVGGHYVAVLGYSFWQNQLGGNPAVVGETIVINGQQMTVLGVAPQGFDGTTLGLRPSVYVPLSMRGIMSQGFTGFDNRADYWAYVFARLKPGVSLEQADPAINGIYRQILNDVEAPLQEGMSDQTMARFGAKQIGLTDGRRGQSSMHSEASTPLILLFTLTGIVLLIACANIANLLLARAASRSMEMAVRLSLGATRRQVLAQLLTESVLLAVLGGVASLVFAHWTLAFITSLLPSEATTSMQFGLRWSAVVFAFALAVVTGLLFGLFPALHSTRPDLVTALRNNSGKLSGSRGAARFRTSLVTAQIALSMALLTSAGLFIKSLRNVSRVDLGLNVENVVTFRIVPIRNGYDSTRSKALFERVEEELSALPGVSGVTAATVPLLAGSNWGNNVSVEGFRQDADTDAGASFNLVGTEYFRTLGIELLAGREFTRSDALGSPMVSIVNEEFTRKFGLGRDAVGKRMAIGRTDTLNLEIVGVVRNAKYSQVKDSVPPLFFQPYRQRGNVGGISFFARTAGDPLQLLRSIPPLVARLDADLPVEDLKTMPQQVRENIFLDRMISILSVSFAAVATLLASIGLYGVLAYSVAQRTREIGVRMALGANAGKVRAMVLRHVAIMTLIGGVVGMVGAVAFGRGARSLLFGLEGHDPAVMVAALAVLALVAFGAGYVPALRASKIAPMEALRYE